MNPIPDYTVVLGVDQNHLDHLETVLPTWVKHKPSLFDRHFLVFFDQEMTKIDQSKIGRIHDILNLCGGRATYELIPWPNREGVPWEIDYPVGNGSKWTNPQRYRMLAGFCHVPANFVRTPYWLKLDLDVVATGQEDWIDPDWFEDDPAIVSHRWGYTKPADQMMKLDEWAEQFNDLNVDPYFSQPRLNLIPSPGSSAIGHKRIISWCAFFNTEFTRHCSRFAEEACGKGMLPVPSQDGYLFYMAKRAGFGVVRTNMKSRGWKHRSNLKRTKEAAKEVMEGVYV